MALESTGSPPAEPVNRFTLAGKIVIVAMDKNPETLEWIKRGVISVTVAQKPYTMSFYGLKSLDDLHHNFTDWQSVPDSPLPTGVDSGTTVVDRKNLTAFQAAGAALGNPL